MLRGAPQIAWAFTALLSIAAHAQPPDDPPAAQPVPAPPPPGSEAPASAAPPSGPPPPPRGRPPPHYYVEPAEPTTPAPYPSHGPPPAYEPPPPGGPGPVLVYEPPPPPEPRHRAPKTALWAGARLGWLVPFNSLWFEGSPAGGLCCDYSRRPWSDYASAGPMFELDVGARLGRRYNLFILWERASLGRGKLEPGSFGGQQRGRTDLYGAGLRFSSNPNRVGLLVELAMGYRRFQAEWGDGTALRLADGLFDMRLGVGADIRITESFSLSPMVTFGSGSFGSATWITPDGTRERATGPLDARAPHATSTLQVGGHLDLLH